MEKVHQCANDQTFSVQGCVLLSMCWGQSLTYAYIKPPCFLYSQRKAI